MLLSLAAKFKFVKICNLIIKINDLGKTKKEYIIRSQKTKSLCVHLPLEKRPEAGGGLFWFFLMFLFLSLQTTFVCQEHN